ncbi:hypothetical protein Tco_0396582 [Tanacetum coccineum]
MEDDKETDEHGEAKEDDEAKVKKHMEVVQDNEEIAIDAIPLATKPLMIVEYKILVKTKHGNTRPEDVYEKVFWGDLKVMFEPDIKSEIWRSLQGYKVTVWKLVDSNGVHFVIFKNLHIFMLVEKRLQADYWNEMCYQLLKLMIQKMNIKFRGGLLGLKDFKMILRVTTAQDQQVVSELVVKL